jgi:hypothetical protein
MTPSPKVELRIPPDTLARIDAAAGPNRSRWIIEACLARLDGEPRPVAVAIATDRKRNVSPIFRDPKAKRL